MDLQLIYDGKALKINEINPQELSTALIAIDNLLKEANLTLKKDKSQLKIESNAIEYTEIIN